MGVNRKAPQIILLTVLATISLILGSCNGSSRLERRIQGMGFKVERDVEGDLRVAVPVPEDRIHTVGVGSHTQNLDEGIKYRNIWAVAARIPGPLPDGLAEDLLGDSWTSRNIGAWALAGQTSDGKEVLVYLIRIEANAGNRTLKAALTDAAVSAAELEEALRGLGDS